MARKSRLEKEIATFKSAGAVSSFFTGLPNPDPVLRKAGLSIQVYRKLLHDSRVRANMQSLKAAVEAEELKIVADDESIVEEYTELKDMIIENNVNLSGEITEADFYGYTPLEINYMKDGNRYIPFEVIGKPQEWFAVDEDTGEWYFIGEDNQKTELNPFKFVFPTSGASYVNPYGVGSASACYWPVIFRKLCWEFWTNGIEKFGTPFILAKTLNNMKSDDRTQLAEDLAAMVQDGVLVTPDGVEMEMLESKSSGTGQSQYEAYLNAANLEISMAIAGTNLTTEVKGGSLAAATTHREIQKDRIDAVLKLEKLTFNTIFSYYNIINYAGARPATVMHVEEEEVSLERSQRDKNILDSDDRFIFTEQYYQREYNFENGDFTLDGGNNDISND